MISNAAFTQAKLVFGMSNIKTVLTDRRKEFLRRDRQPGERYAVIWIEVFRPAELEFVALTPTLTLPNLYAVQKSSPMHSGGLR